MAIKISSKTVITDDSDFTGRHVIAEEITGTDLEIGTLNYPNTDPGHTGYVMTTDGAGNLSLQEPPASGVISAEGGDGITVVDTDGEIEISADLGVGLDFSAGQDKKIDLQAATTSTLGGITVGAGLSVTGAGELSADLGAVQFQGGVDLTNALTIPTDPANGDAYINTKTGVAAAGWASVTDGLVSAQAVQSGDIVVWKAEDSNWVYVAGNDTPGTDLEYVSAGNNDATLTSTTGDPATIPIATDTVAGLFTGDEKQKLAGIDAGAQVNEVVNLGYTPAANGGTVTNSSSGSDASLPLATSSNAGLMSPTEKTTIDNLPDNVADADDIGDATLTINDSDGNKLADFSANQSTPATVEVTLPKGFSGDYDDLDNKPDLSDFITDPGVEKIIAGTGLEVDQETGIVTINSTITALEYGGTVDVTKSDLPAIRSDAQRLYVNTGPGYFSDAWAAITSNAETTDEANPGDFMIREPAGADLDKQYSWVPAGSPPTSDGLWVEAGGKLSPATLSNDVLVGGADAASATIQLNTNGSATFAGGITTQGYVVSQRYSQQNREVGIASVAAIQGEVDNYGFVITDKANATLQCGILLDGSATFKGSVVSSSTGSTSANMGLGGVLLGDYGAIQAIRPGTTDNPSTKDVWTSGYGANQTAKIYADGSATFAGQVDARILSLGGKSYTDPGDGGVWIGVGNDPTAQYKHQIYHTANDGRSNFIEGYSAVDVDTEKTQVFSIANNGSATFKGDVNRGGNPYLGIEEGVGLANPGKIMVCRSSGVTFESYTQGNTSPTISFDNTGSATFAGSVNTSYLEITADPAQTSGNLLKINGASSGVATIGYDGSATFGSNFAIRGSDGTIYNPNGGWKIDGGDGSASFGSGNIQVGNSDDKAWAYLKNTGGAGTYITKPSGDELGITNNSSIIGAGTEPIKLNGANGSATFAGGITTQGYVVSQRYSQQNREVGIASVAAIQGEVDNYGFVITDKANATLQCGILLDGSATFAGTVTAAKFDLEALPPLS